MTLILILLSTILVYFLFRYFNNKLPMSSKSNRTNMILLVIIIGSIPSFIYKTINMNITYSLENIILLVFFTSFFLLYIYINKSSSIALKLSSIVFSKFLKISILIGLFVIAIFFSHFMVRFYIAGGVTRIIVYFAGGILILESLLKNRKYLMSKLKINKKDE